MRRAQECAMGLSGIWEKICRPVRGLCVTCALDVCGGHEFCGCHTALLGVMVEGARV